MQLILEETTVVLVGEELNETYETRLNRGIAGPGYPTPIQCSALTCKDYKFRITILIGVKITTATIDSQDQELVTDVEVTLANGPTV